MAYQHSNSGYLSYEDSMSQRAYFSDSMSHNPVVGIDEIDPSLTEVNNATRYVEYQQSYQSPEQHQPLQRYIGESTQMGPLMHATSMSNTVASVPRSSTRMNSPTPSLYSHDFTATSSANSPVDENELLYDPTMYSPHNNYEFYPQQSHSGSQFLPDLALLGTSIPQYSLPSNTLSNDCVNMSQVQNYADYGDNGFDEGYSMQNGGDHDFIEVDHPIMRADTGNSYQFNGDEGLGTSIPDGLSQHSVDTPAIKHDFDADADFEDDSATASDEEYTPHHKSTRGSTMRRSKRSRDSYDSSTSSCVTKRSRPTKPSTTSMRTPSHFANNTNNGTYCASCNSSFTTSALLSKHVSKEHTKPFICVFSFAGCGSVFATKNEWKRHVYSQHCNFFTWTCDIGDCAKPHSKGKNASGSAANANASHSIHGGAHFNRKDLYTQHLKRMHTPRQAQKGGKGSVAAAAWEKSIRLLQESNCHVTRRVPGELECPVASCRQPFQGKNCWDEKMEHVGKHLEMLAQARGGGSGDIEEFDQGADQLMVQWAIREGIVVADGEGEFVFVGDASKKRVEVSVRHGRGGEMQGSEDDAEGEDEAEYL